MNFRCVLGCLGLGLSVGCGNGNTSDNGASLGGETSTDAGGTTSGVGGQTSQGGRVGQGGAVGGASQGQGGLQAQGGTGQGGVGRGGQGSGGSPIGPGGTLGVGGYSVVGVGGATGGAGTGGAGTGGAGTGGTGTGGTGTGGTGTAGTGTGGTGTCASGLSPCGGECVDLASDPANCGRCGNECGESKVCANSTCKSGTPTGDDGCFGPAHSVTLSKVAVYQATEVPLMEGGTATPAEDYTARVIQGRDAMVRVHVELASTWTAREVSVRLNLTNAGTTETLYAKKTFTSNSEQSSLNSTANLQIPAEKITADTQYSVEIVECTAATGTIASPRFPVDGSASLDAIQTGPIKIVLLPIQTDSFIPDTSDAAISLYRDYVAAMYPVTSVEFTVGDTITASTPVDWEAVLDQIFTKREEDAPTDDVYYYGLLKPADTLREYCQVSCTAGIGYVLDTLTGWGDEAYRVACGLAYVDEIAGSTMAHEVGHNQGRYHSPCDVERDPSDPDPYPMDDGTIRTWGYDARTGTLMNPAEVPDVMSYCDSPWIGDFTFMRLAERIALVNGVTSHSTLGPALPEQAWQKLLVTGSTARWGATMKRPHPARGTAETAMVYDEVGDPITEVTVYRVPLSNPGQYTILVPELEPGWGSIAVSGLDTIAFAR